MTKLQSERCTYLKIVLTLAFIVCVSNSVSAATNIATSVFIPEFTNLANRIIRGVPESVTNGMVRFNGRSIPLSVFPQTERRRILLSCDACEIPPALTAKLDFYRNAARRIDAMEAASSMDAAEAERQRNLLIKAWTNDLNSSPDVSPEEAIWWLSRSGITCKSPKSAE